MSFFVSKKDAGPQRPASYDRYCAQGEGMPGGRALRRGTEESSALS